MLCSIIIRAFNEEKHIEKIIDGIQNQHTIHDVEIILVDSGSTDNTVLLAQKKGVKIISIAPEDFSFGYALNKGCDNANGDILLFASAHVYPVYTHWIDSMLRPFTDEKVALVYGRQIGHEKSKYSEKRLMAKWFPGYSNYNQQHPFCNNANSAIRKKHWQQQMYDESLTGLEDLDWASKIIAQGYKIAYEAEAVIVHVHEETNKKIYNRYYREAIAFKRIVPYAQFSIWSFFYLLSTNVFSDYYYAIQDRVFWKNFLDIPTFRFFQFLGTWKGYNHTGNIDYSLRAKFYYPNNFLRRHEHVVIRAPRIEYSSNNT
ncbi:glycosyltransferase [Dyadobacter sp. CY351]|uniref:glycosyltransferase family 2 protein n=1 Tax=Dyadobacter sp. CY351 TaxID=2909337 RepID=UPI001F25122F|nr:glycosyltransferase [Dyadobacter sp. CY351]MCF2518431.1 glycosyltransferase [Dyadobacter sp. CY351]